MTTSPEVAAILDRARETLRDAGLGLRDLIGSDPNRRLAGLRNAVVFGRAVTNVIQNLRSKVVSFDDWYEPHRALLAADPSFQELYRMRSAILKEGATDVGVVTHVNSFSTADLARYGPPPPGAAGFFIGDSRGGSGWTVPMPDGSEEKYYVELPPAVASSTFVMQVGERRDVPVAGVLARYLRTLGEIVRDAERRFGSE